MNFNWDHFTENDFVDYCARMENGMIDCGECIGLVLVGNISFVLIVRDSLDNKLYLSADLYVKNDDGSAYSFKSTG